MYLVYSTHQFVYIYHEDVTHYNNCKQISSLFNLVSDPLCHFSLHLFVSETVYPPYPKLIPMISANIKNGTQVLRTPAVSVYLPIKKNQMAIPTIPRPKMRDSM